MNRTLIAAAVVALAIILPKNSPAVEILEDVVQQTYPIDPDATINISNADGSIRIYAGNVKEISLTAIKKAYTEDRLRAIEIVVKADLKSVTISTKFPPAPSNWSFRDRSGTVEYTLIVPPTVRVAQCDLESGEILVEGLHDGGSAKAHLVNGWLAGHNCFADLDLAIVNGRLDVAYDWWENKPFAAKAESVNGGIRALLPWDASIQVDAKCDHGNVASVFPADDDESRKSRTKMGPQMNFEMNEPNGRSLRMHATNGNIRVDKSY